MTTDQNIMKESRNYHSIYGDFDTVTMSFVNGENVVIPSKVIRSFAHDPGSLGMLIIIYKEYAEEYYERIMQCGDITGIKCSYSDGSDMEIKDMWDSNGKALSEQSIWIGKSEDDRDGIFDGRLYIRFFAK